MHPQDIKLIKEHAGWILECDPEAGLEALLAMNPPLSTQLVKPLLEVGTAVHVQGAGVLVRCGGAAAGLMRASHTCL